MGESAKADKEIYIRNVSEILEPSGLLLITSCNWTEAELGRTVNTCFIVCKDTMVAKKLKIKGVGGKKKRDN